MGAYTVSFAALIAAAIILTMQFMWQDIKKAFKKNKQEE